MQEQISTHTTHNCESSKTLATPWFQFKGVKGDILYILLGQWFFGGWWGWWSEWVRERGGGGGGEGYRKRVTVWSDCWPHDCGLLAKGTALQHTFQSEIRWETSNCLSKHIYMFTQKHIHSQTHSLESRKLLSSMVEVRQRKKKQLFTRKNACSSFEMLDWSVTHPNGGMKPCIRALSWAHRLLEWCGKLFFFNYYWYGSRSRKSVVLYCHILSDFGTAVSVRKVEPLV